MKKILLSAVITSMFSTTLLSKSVYTLEYQLHSDIYDKSINIENASKKEIFFGTKIDYYEFVSEGLKEIQLKGLEGALSGMSNQSANIAKGFLEAAGKGVAIGAGIGIIIGAIESYKKESRKSAEYMYLVEFTTLDGKTTKGSVLLSSRKEEFKNNPNMENIKKIMNGAF